ncbi:MAG: condensation domain-containing protein [Nannocystaceae bacterium]
MLRAGFVAADDDAAALRMIEGAPSLRVEAIAREGEGRDDADDGDDGDDGDAAAVAALRQAIFRPFDLERPPLLRAGIAPRGPDRAVIALAAHHLVFDNHSLARLLDELRGLLSGEAVDAPAGSFLDEVERAAEATAPEALAAWWRRHLDGARWPLPVAHDVEVPVPEVVSPEPLELDRDEARGLRRVAEAAGASVEAAIGLAFALSLAATLDLDEAVTAWALSTRTPGQRGIVGPMIDNAMLRVRASAEGTLVDALQALDRQMTEVRGHAGLPFRRLTEPLLGVQDPREAPPCPVLFTFHDADSMDIPPAIRGLLRGDRTPCGARSLRRLPADRRSARRPYDYFAYAEARDGRIALALRVQRRRVGLELGARIAGRWGLILRTLARRPDARLRELMAPRAPQEVDRTPPRGTDAHEGSRCPRP